MTEFEGGARQEAPKIEGFVAEVERKVQTVFPGYSDTDRESYDSYKKEEDIQDKGRWLRFYTEAGRGEKDPVIWFIFRDETFALNYYNAKPENTDLLQNPNNSMYGPRQREWKLDEVELALEKHELHLEGLDPENEVFLNQLVAWSDQEGRFLTMNERIEEFAPYRGLKPKDIPAKIKTKMRKELNVWDLLDQNPDKAKELVVKRISNYDEYQLFDGTIIPSADVVIAINSGAGEHYVVRELNLIESQEFLLGDHHLLYR